MRTADDSTRADYPNENRLVQRLEGQLSAVACAELHAHVDRCRRCRMLLVELAPILAALEVETDPDPAPLDGRLGRYEIGALLGRGGMGLVYEAFDPDLDRRVALKILHTIRPRGQDRILREARAMARLSDPHVVQVHETGRYAGGWYIAMELVEGSTLDEWAVGRPWAARLVACLQAGAGLAAAHAAGLVHRDFKPSNVLCGADGRARVTDFGLVGAPGSTESSVEGEPDPDAPRSLTRSGAVLGTPAFMAPEQRRAQTVDARSDQYAFCSTVWRLLAGAPGHGLHPEIPAADSSWPAGAPRVSPRLIAVLRRGLSDAPADRWPSMDALRKAAARAVAPRWGRWLWIPVAAAALAGLWVLQSQRAVALQQRHCHDWAATIDAVYGPPDQARTAAVIAATAAPYADVATAHVERLLAAKAEAWATTAEQACLARNVTATLSAADGDKAQWCLVEHRIALQVTVDALAGLDARTVDKAVLLAAEPFVVAACADPATLPLLSAPPPDADRRQAVLARRALLRADALQSEAKVAEALSVARAATWHAVQAHTPAMALEGRARQASLLSWLGDTAVAESTGVAAYLEAMAAGAWSEAFRAAIAVADTVAGSSPTRHLDGLLWVDLADAALAHAADPLSLRRARALVARASIEVEGGAVAAGQAHDQHAAEIRARVLGPTHLLALRSQVSVATDMTMQGQLQPARALLFDSRGGLVEILGDAHPTVAAIDATIAQNYLQGGEFAVAQPRIERAVATLRRQPHADPHRLARLIRIQAQAAMMQGEFATAQRLLEESVAMHQASGPAARADIAVSLGDLANVNRFMGGLDLAQSRFERAILLADVLGPNHPERAVLFHNLGGLHLANKRPEAAIAAYREALRIQQQAANPVAIASVRLGLGTALHAAKRHQDAIEQLEQVITLRRAAGIEGAKLAFAEFTLAVSLWDAAPGRGRDQTRAVALARAAMKRAAGETVTDETVRDLVQAWLSRRGLAATD